MDDFLITFESSFHPKCRLIIELFFSVFRAKKHDCFTNREIRLKFVFSAIILLNMENKNWIEREKKTLKINILYAYRSTISGGLEAYANFCNFCIQSPSKQTKKRVLNFATCILKVIIPWSEPLACVFHNQLNQQNIIEIDLDYDHK